jgi:hypothetical protein
MTAKEEKAIDALRNTVEKYNQDVVRVFERQDFAKNDIADLKATVNGIPGDDNAPGLVAQVKSLLQSRSYAHWMGNALWAVALLLIGACIRHLFGI